MKRREANLEQWSKLYDVAVGLKVLKPWEYIWDMDLIAIILPEYEEPFFCSVMGKAGECLGIGTYEGFDAIHGFYYIANNQQISSSQLIRYQNNLMCYFGNREELTKKDLEVIKSIGLKFRGKNEWIYFRSFEPGYAPYMLDELQVVKLTQVLQNLYMSLEALVEGKVKVDFDSGNILYRRYDEESRLWLTHGGPNLIPPRRRINPVLTDELLLAKFKKQKSIKNEIELDTLYLNSIIDDKEFEKPILGRLLLIADCKSRRILDQHLLSPKDDVIQNIFGIFINYLLHEGKPKTVYVRDHYIEDYLQDLCEKLGISLKVKGKLKTIDFFERNLMKHGF
ncbi:MAG: DUF7309 domain-containing protein [Zhaonellaceae bacterium]|nr:hypothetical protein [Clostridia bacterium]